MAEPVLQGVVQKGHTRFLVLPPVAGVEELGVDDAGEGHAELEAGASSSDEGTIRGAEDSEEDDQDDYEIDEAFLAASVLSPGRQSLPPTPLSPPSSNGLALTNGHAAFPLESTSSSTKPSPTSIAVLPASLQQPIPSPLLIPRPPNDEDDTPRVYLRTSDLGRLGLFSGDWVVVGDEGNEHRRLARAFAGAGLLPETSADGSISAYLPPTLLHNLHLEPSASLTVSPARLSSPSFPTAHSVTVARIASPHSVNRAYQSLFLDGLKQYFQSHRRVLKKGDIIAVGICEDTARFTEGKADDDDVELPASSSSPTAVVFFQITSLELSSSLAPLRIEGGTSEEALLDQLDAGELGCYVDPYATKLLQTGLERSLAPDVAGFLGIPDTAPISTALNVLGDATPASRLLEYVQASLRKGASDYDLHLTVLVKGARGSGKRTVVRSIARKTGFHLLELDCFELLGESDLKTEGHLRARIDKAISCSPCMLLLRNIEALARKSQALETGQEPAMSTVLKECFAVARQGWKSSGYPIIILATACDVEKVPTSVLGAFKEELSIEAPGEPERLSILRSLTTTSIIAPDVSLRALAVQTAALVANDLVDLVRRARASAADRVLALAPSARLQDLQHAGVALTAVDFNDALEKARSSYSESIGAPKIPSVTWDDVGGLANVKSDILDTIQLPLEHPELFADGMKKRSGILLYGPPGTGKTLLAKAVATSCSLNFFSVKGPELLNMYIGESEANVRRVFQRARDAKPCVIFFDELDSVAPKRGNQGDSGGVMDRIVSQLLAELDGMAEGKGGSDVFVIGATNRPDLLDPALLRPGRFDRMLYLGVSDNHDSQLKIIQALTRKFKLDPNIRLEDVAALCPFNYTGADFYALCSDAMLKAMTRKAEEVDATIAELNSKPPYSTGTPLTPQYYLAELATPAEIEVLVSQRDFEAALAEAEMQHYATVQRRFSAETMNSDDKIAQKQVETAKPNGISLPNGIHLNGAATSSDDEDEVPVKKDKGKSKARQE
uniref:Peroxisomal ATPase PEX6 n=1 Tax=Leucosporidium scottii TaxID=5278 RepID=A0A0H5FUP4_9BASI|nr:hypothetical protein ls5930a1_00167 [Leucosporidium scottii]CRX79213.1 hypothetical protein ls5931a1_00041 [Leucosporidium scottii]